MTGGSQTWLASPLWDSLLLLSGLWLVAIVAGAQAAGYVPAVPNMLALGGVALLWGGHILSPVVVSWANCDLRAHMLRNRGRFVAAPMAILLVSIGLGLLGDLSQWSLVPPGLAVHVNPRLALFYAFLVWNTWHFASQHFGVLSVYRRVAGQTSAADRRMDRLFSVIMTCGLTPLAWYVQGIDQRFGRLLAYLPGPAAFPSIGIVIIAAALALTLACVAWEVRKPATSLPRSLYLVSIGIQPIFATISYPLYQAAVFSICHWLVALGLASRILDREFAAESDGHAAVDGVRPGFLICMSGFALASLVMFAVFHSRTVHALVGIAPASAHSQESLFAYRAGVFSLGFGALSGAYFGVSFVHFMYDRYVYAFRRPEIRQWIAPHLFSPADAPERRV